MSTYKCPTCGYVAKIEGNRLEITIPKDQSQFPNHANCELAKSLDKIDVSKLEKA